MAGKKEFIERKKHERFKVKNAAIAMIRPLNSDAATQKYCQIINISKDGLSFRYIYRKDESNEQIKLDLLFIQDSICFTYLKNVPFEIVWVSNETSKTSSSHLKTRQLDVQFGEMTSHQISQLDRFLEECTIK